MCSDKAKFVNALCPWDEIVLNVCNQFSSFYVSTFGSLPPIKQNDSQDMAMQQYFKNMFLGESYMTHTV